MKKTLAILLSLAICVMSGCAAGETLPAATETITQAQPTLETTEPVPSAEETASTIEATTDSTEASTAYAAEQHTTDETVPETTVPQNTTPKETKPKETQPKEMDPDAPAPAETVPAETEPPETEPPATDPPVTEPPETEPPTTNPPATDPPETDPPDTEAETEPATEPEPVVPDYAFKREVAAYAAQYINQYRSSPCTVLSGMSQVAQYRAGQLCYNFSHSTSDKRAALAYYEYGRWIDATEAGLDASLSYYESDTSEAICRGVRGTDAEALGKAIADAIRASGSHWSYVGSSEYSYIGVGVEYRDDSYGWYVCVMVGTVNYG